MDPANTEFAMIAKSALLPEECDSAQLTMVGQTEQMYKIVGFFVFLLTWPVN